MYISNIFLFLSNKERDAFFCIWKTEEKLKQVSMRQKNRCVTSNPSGLEHIFDTFRKRKWNSNFWNRDNKNWESGTGLKIRLSDALF